MYLEICVLSHNSLSCLKLAFFGMLEKPVGVYSTIFFIYHSDMLAIKVRLAAALRVTVRKEHNSDKLWYHMTTELKKTLP